MTQKSFFKPINHSLIEKNLEIHQPIKALVFDIGGVLLTHSPFTVISHVGIPRVLKYTLFDFKNPLSLQEKVNDLLNIMIEREGVIEKQKLTTLKGHPIPPSIEAWQKGKLTSEQMLEIILATIEEMYAKQSFSSDREKEVVQRLATAMILPKTQAEAKQQIIQITNLVRAIYHLQENGERKYKLFIISNIEADVVPFIKEKFKELFTLFDDIIASGEVGMIKPDRNIFEHLLTKHNLAPHECVFIDDLPENIATAKELGFHTCHVEHKNYHLVFQKLRELKVF